MSTVVDGCVYRALFYRISGNLMSTVVDIRYLGKRNL